jgi:hypothetical protein
MGLKTVRGFGGIVMQAGNAGACARRATACAATVRRI